MSIMATDENNDLQESGKILLQINNGDENVSEWSREEMIGGFKWHLRVKKAIQSKGKTMVEICIACNLDCCLGILWMAKVDILIEYPQKKSFTINDEYFFNGYKLGRFLRFASPINNEIIADLILTLKIHWSSSKTKIMALDNDLKFSIPKLDNPASNVEVIVPVNKYALAAISNYFRSLFFGDWSERSNNANSFTIKEEVDFNVKAFKLMVYSAMAMGWMVHESNIFLGRTLTTAILKLSIKYDIQLIQNYCEKRLIHSKKCPKMELLEAAEQLGLENLKEHALSTICPLDVSQDFGRNADIRARLSEPTRRELDKRMADKTEELRKELVKKRKIDKN